MAEPTDIEGVAMGGCPKCGLLPELSIALDGDTGWVTVRVKASCACGIPFMWTMRQPDRQTLDVDWPIWVEEQD